MSIVKTPWALDVNLHGSVHAKDIFTRLQDFALQMIADSRKICQKYSPKTQEVELKTPRSDNFPF